MLTSYLISIAIIFGLHIAERAYWSKDSPLDYLIALAAIAFASALFHAVMWCIGYGIVELHHYFGWYE